MTTRVDLSPELKKKMADLEAGRPTWTPDPKPVTTIKPPRGK